MKRTGLNHHVFVWTKEMRRLSRWMVFHSYYLCAIANSQNLFNFFALILLLLVPRPSFLFSYTGEHLKISIGYILNTALMNVWSIIRSWKANDWTVSRISVQWSYCCKRIGTRIETQFYDSPRFWRVFFHRRNSALCSHWIFWSRIVFDSNKVK